MMKVWCVLFIFLLTVFVFEQDIEEFEKARTMFPPEITRAILEGNIEAPEGFDEAITKRIGEKRLKLLRSRSETVSGRDNDEAALCLMQLGVNAKELKKKTAMISVKFTGSKYKVAADKNSGFFKTGQDADIMLSGIDFNNTGGALLFNHPAGIATDGTHLFLADTYNNRVLVWKTLPRSNVEPDIVLGQKDFKSNNSGSGRDEMNFPINVTAAGERIVVADTENHRLLVWNKFPEKNGTPADMIITFGDDSKGIEPAKNKILWPWGVWTDNEKLVVSSTRGSSVLIWNKFPTKENQPADIILKGKFGTPRTITSDGKSLIVGDHNAKLNPPGSGTFFWKNFPTKDNQPYDFSMRGVEGGIEPWLRGNFLPDGRLVLIGQTLHIFNSFPKNENAKPKISIRGFDFRSGDHTGSVYADGRLYICCGNKNMIVVYNSIPTKPEQQPDYAIGSPDIHTNTLETNFIISNPVPATNGKSLFVSSDFDRKLYVWKQIPDESGAHPDIVYNLTDGAWDIEIWKDTLAIAGHRTIYIWKKLPLDGEQPDVIFVEKIGSVKFKKLLGVALDDKYFYIADNEANKIYVWEGIPEEESEPVFSLNFEGVGRLSSDGNYLAAAPFVNHFIRLYIVSDLSANSKPHVIGKPKDENHRQGASMFNMAPSAQVSQNHLFIAEGAGSKVHIWKNIEDAIAGESADVIIGEDNFEDRVPETARNKLHYPAAVWFDENYLWVGETKFSERILRFSPRP